MSVAREGLLALRLLGRDLRAGELALIVAAIAIAVGAVGAVGFFSDRVHRALERRAERLLGADLAVSADRPLAPAFEAEAARRGLAVARVARFPSMVLSGAKSALADVKAVSVGYPLRGEVRIAPARYGMERRAAGIPERGEAWVDERLADALGLEPGAKLALGAHELRVAAILTHDPDATIGFLSAAPRILVNEADLQATGLVQPASRIRYRLQFAGAERAVEGYRDWVRARLTPGMRIEAIGEARPEVKAALERAGRYAGLAALLAGVLAAVGIAFAARRFVQRHLDGCALLRCFGAARGRIDRIYTFYLVLLAAGASAAGCGGALVAQALLARWMEQVVGAELPPAGALPALQGFGVGLLLVLGFALPPLRALGRVPALRVLRRELGAARGAGLGGYLVGPAALGALIVWRAGEITFGLIVLGGFFAATLVAAALAWGAVRGLELVRERGVSWRFGVANLRRRPLATVVQVVALALGIMALLTLTLVRTELVRAWQRSLSPQAPNRFVLNIQPAQLEPLSEFFRTRGIAPPPFFPMVRGRLIGVNGRPVSSADYTDERARRLIDREFNLSWAMRLPPDNRIVAGRWFEGRGAPPDQFSVEQGIARALGIGLGDLLTYDVAGSLVAGRVTSLRSVEWQSFRVNFFVIAPPGLLEPYPVSYITSFYAPPRDAALVQALVRAFPNLLVIDVAQLVRQLFAILDQIAHGVQLVFVFTLAAGLVVLYAGVVATREERLQQAAVLRALGARRAQIVRANLAEFAALGALAGLVAAAGANGLGAALAAWVLDLRYDVFDPWVWVAGVGLGAAGVGAAGHLGVRRVLKTAPVEALRQAPF